MSGLDRPALATGRPPRVAIAMPGGFDFGGIGRMMLYATRGWSASADAPDWWPVDARGDGSLVWSPWLLLRAAIGLRRRRPDLLHLNVADKGSTLRKLVLDHVAARLGIPTIVHLHYGAYDRDLARRSRFVRRRVEAMFRRAALVLVLGEHDRQVVEEVVGVPRERIRILHNAVPDPGPPPARSGREGPVRLLFLGRFDAPEKGVRELLAALALPALRARDWQLTIAGRGETRVLEHALAAAGVGERVSFAGWLPQAEVYDLCRAADVFVLPSFREGQAVSLLEAMAHGLAIVTTPVGAHLEAVTDEAEALLVAPGDIAGLATALTRLIDDPPLRASLGAAAHARYCCQFNADQYSKKLRQIYSRVLGDQPPIRRPEN